MKIMASMLSYFWLKFTDILLFAMRLVICTQTSNIDFFDLEGSSSFAAYRSVLYMRRWFEVVKDAV
jgi:hypothetical protein